MRGLHLAAIAGLLLFLTPGVQAQDDRAVEEAVQQYGGRPKPALPEETRRLKLQAEAAIQSKAFEDAVRLYGEGTKLSPWWSEGYHNAAVLLAELGNYGDAIRNMERFIRLEPGTAAARAGQDRIYQWQFEEKRANDELALWNSAKDSQSEADLKGYLERYPNGRYAGQARIRLEGLERAATQERERAARAAQERENKAMTILPGLWQAQIANNYYQMAVSWNEANKRFEGTLAVQGVGSRNVGFTVGELVWIAVPTGDPNVLTEHQMWRWGGLFSGYKWAQGAVYLSRSSRDTLVTSTASFRRVQ